MLREILNIKQHPDEPFRRWFHCQEQDLYIWQDSVSEITAFQLCYNKPHNEHAIYWRKDRGYSHLRVDNGDNLAPSSQTPLLVADGLFNPETLIHRFEHLGKALPREISAFVLEHLKNYPQTAQQNNM